MTVTTLAPVTTAAAEPLGWRDRLRLLHAWAHRGPARTLVMKVLATFVGAVVITAGVAMLVLPGPGLVVMGIGVGVLATEWPWAVRILHLAKTRLSAARTLLFPRDAPPVRRAVGGAVVASVAGLGFAATTATTFLLGSTALM